MTRLRGVFRSLIYSPKGGIEGVMLTVDGDESQLVFDRHDASAGELFRHLQPGAAITVEAESAPASPKGEAEHAVYAFERLIAVDDKPLKAAAAGIEGEVVRLNYARHGARNGVILHTGDFVHTKPEGMRKWKLQIGDRISAKGAMMPLAHGPGRVIEAKSIKRLKS